MQKLLTNNPRYIFLFDIWRSLLYTMIILFYVGAFFESTWVWALVLPVGLVLLMLAKKIKITVSDFSHMGLFWAVMAWVFLSLLWSISPDDTFKLLRNLIPKLIITFLAAKIVAGDERLIGFLPVLLTLCLGALSLYMLLKFGKIRLKWYDAENFIGIFSNVIAAGLAITAPMLVFAMKRTNAVYIAPALISCITLVTVSQSRAGLGTLVGGVFLAVLLRNRVSVVSIFVGGFAVTFLSYVAYLVMVNYSPETMDRLGSVFDTVTSIGSVGVDYLEEDTEDYARKIQALFTIDKIKELPILGVGYGSFAIILERDFGIAVQSHSLFGTFFVELGLIGFLLYMWFLGSLFIRLIRKYKNCFDEKERNFTGMALTIFIVTNASFLFRPQLTEVTYFISVGLALAAIRPAARAKRKTFLRRETGYSRSFKQQAPPGV